MQMIVRQDSEVCYLPRSITALRRGRRLGRESHRDHNVSDTPIVIRCLDDVLSCHPEAARQACRACRCHRGGSARVNHSNICGASATTCKMRTVASTTTRTVLLSL